MVLNYGNSFPKTLIIIAKRGMPQYAYTYCTHLVTRPTIKTAAYSIAVIP